MCAQAWKPLHFRDRRRVPFAGERLGFRGVQAHCQIEWSPRRGEPVGFHVLSGTLVLEIEIERAIGIMLERHPAAYREAVQDVADLQSLLIVKGDRPEGIDRRRSALLETDGVLVCTIERLAGFVAE